MLKFTRNAWLDIHSAAETEHWPCLGASLGNSLVGFLIMMDSPLLLGWAWGKILGLSQCFVNLVPQNSHRCLFSPLAPGKKRIRDPGKVLSCCGGSPSSLPAAPLPPACLQVQRSQVCLEGKHSSTSSSLSLSESLIPNSSF